MITCKCQCIPDKVSFWYMRDNCTFVRLKGKTIDDIIKHAKKCLKKDRWGMLCGATLLCDEKEVRVVDVHIHGYEWDDEKLLEWKRKILQDEDVCRIMNEKM